jgi:hypothetical protein
MDKSQSQQQPQPVNDHLNIIAKLEIPCRKTSLTYDKTVYKEDILQDILEQEEFDKILDECSKILGDAIDKKRTNDEVKIPKFIVILSIIASLLALVYIICLFTAANSTDNQTFMVVLAVFCLTGAGGIVFVLSLFNFCRKIKTFRTLEAYVKDDMDAYLDKINLGFTGKCEFKFYPHKEEAIEICTFVKTPQMIKEEMIENNRMQQLEQDDNENENHPEKHSKIHDMSERSTMLKMDDDSKIGFKGNKSTAGKDLEMVGIISAAQNSVKEDQSLVKKKFGGVRKKNQ